MDTFTQRIESAAARGRGDIVFLQGDEADRVPWSQLHEEARAMAAALQDRGVRPGDHVALIGPTSRALVTALQATWLAGAATVVLPLPMRLSSIEEFIAQTRVRLRASESVITLIDADLAAFITPEPADPPMVGFEEIQADAARLGSGVFRRPDDDPDRLAILQFTSGSTDSPKGVTVLQRNLVANLDAIQERTRFVPDTDRLVSWLPLYHDMGLIGVLGLTMYSGAGMVLAAPQDFMAHPARWMQWISDYQGTATAGPNFAYVLATRGMNNADEPLDLSSLRVALNGAEPIDPGAMRAFVEAGARHQLNPGAVFPAFGMAETTIAGSFPDPGQGLRVDVVDATVLENERYAASVPADHPSARELVILGRAMDGLEFRITDSETGRVLAERDVGELEIRGSSVTAQYYNDRQRTHDAFRDDWFRTGDLAYLVDGQLVLCGRIKDVIIVGGRNVYPQDIERAAGEIEGVRTGNVIAFGVDGRRGKQTVVVVAETRSEDLDLTRKLVADHAREAVGLPVKEVCLVAPGTLPKTSSGKLQRVLCKQRYLDGELELAATSQPA